MIVENVVAQMLMATGRKLHFYSINDPHDAERGGEVVHGEAVGAKLVRGGEMFANVGGAEWPRTVGGSGAPEPCPRWLAQPCSIALMSAWLAKSGLKSGETS